MDDLLGAMNCYEFVLPLTLSHPDCHTTIVGSADLDHLRANVAAAKAGSLPKTVCAEAAPRLTAIGESRLEV